MSLSIGTLVGYVGLDTSAAEAAADKLGSFFEGKGGEWGKALGAVGVLAGGAFAASLAGAIDMEPSRDRVAAALGLTEEQAKRAGEVSGRLFAGAWGESAADVDAAVEAVMSSIKGMRSASEDELFKVTAAAMDLSTAMGIDVARAAQVAGNMVSNGLAKDGIAAMDLLGAAMSKVPVQLREDVLDATDEYGQFFNALGIKGPQAMGLLTQSAGKGMYGIDKMGDAIKEFTILATDGSESSRDAMRGIGLGARQIERDLLAGGSTANKAFGQVVDALLKVKDPAAQSQAALALFGTPLEDLGTKDIPKFLKSLDSGKKGLKGWKGATEDMGATLNDNAKTNLTAFTRQLQTGFVDLIGGKVLPKVTDWTSALSTGLGPALSAVGDILKDVTDWLEDHSTVAKTLAGVIAALVVVTAAHSAVLAVGAAGGMVAWLKGIRLVSAATKVWQAVQWALNIAMSANPMVLITMAIAALVVGLIIAYKKSDTFRAIVNKAFSKVKDVAGKVFPKIGEIISKVFGAIKKIFQNIPIVLIIRHWDTIKEKTRAAFQWVNDKIRSLFGGAVGWVREKIGALVGFFAELPGRISRKVAGAFDGLKAALRGALAWIATKWNSFDLEIGPFKIPDWVPKVGGNSFHIPDVFPDIPGLATGGRVTGETIARIGEREPETVLRDRDIVALLTKAREAGRSDVGAGRGAPLIGQVVQRDDEPPHVLAERLWHMTRTRP